MSGYTQLARELKQRGQQQFGAWNDAAFEAYVAGPVANLHRQLEWQQKKEKQGLDIATIGNYLQLVYEGVGAGWLSTIVPDVPPPTFLAHCLGTLAPYRISEVPRSERAETLRHVWNLGEGLAREPQWLNQYAITRTDWSVDLRKLDEHLTKILAPVLSPLPPATWQGELSLQVISLRKRADAFVPGRMYLASPAVLCVEDRIASGETLAILLQKSGKSSLLGSVGRLPEHVESFAAPAVEPLPDAIIVNGREIAAPLISSPRQSLCTASGFVAVSADDSQHLWMVESA